SGMEATRILAHHPSAEVRLATSDRWQGESIERRTGVGAAAGKLRYAPQEKAVDLAGERAAALRCTPVEVSLEIAPALLASGRKASEELSFVEVMDDFRAYRVLRHQHTPEIAQSLSAAAGAEIDLTFTPHLLPLRRGILATSYLRLAPGASAKDVGSCFLHEYAAEPFL